MRAHTPDHATPLQYKYVLHASIKYNNEMPKMNSIRKHDPGVFHHGRVHLFNTEKGLKGGTTLDLSII